MPVRGGSVGKTRLTQIDGRDLSQHDRLELALAMAQDTLAAAADVPGAHTFVLTASPVVGELAGTFAIGVLDDAGRGLNAELDAAVAQAPAASNVAVLLGDIPAVRTQDLMSALGEASAAYDSCGVPSLVTDWEGTGTALIALPGGLDERPGLAFGVGSARRHQSLGFREIGTTLARLRCDVDTPSGWQRAVALGLGPATTAVRAELLGP